MSDELDEEVNTLLERYTRRLERKQNLLQDGAVAQDSLDTFYSGVANYHKRIGILHVYQRRLDRAREHFQAAAEDYQKSARENSIDVLKPKTLTQGCYMAALSGDSEAVRSVANSIQVVLDSTDLDPPAAHADGYFVAGALAGAILDSIDAEVLEELKSINASKSTPHSDYGQAIIEFSTGLSDRDAARVEAGVRSMVKYHKEEQNENEVIKRIMSTEATALLSIARQKGYAITVESEFISQALVDATL